MPIPMRARLGEKTKAAAMCGDTRSKALVLRASHPKGVSAELKKFEPRAWLQSRRNRCLRQPPASQKEDAMHAFMIQLLFAPKGCIPMRARLGEKNSRNVRQATGRVFLKFAELKKFGLKAWLKRLRNRSAVVLRTPHMEHAMHAFMTRAPCTCTA